jgi:hypothetical protein
MPTSNFTAGLNLKTGFGSSYYNTANTFSSNVSVNTLTGNQTLTIPDATGTIALTSSLPIHSNSTTTGTGTTAVTVTIGSTMANTNYYVDIAPQDLLTAVNWYVSAKTTTTFTITFVSALTGSINFDWDVIP